MFPHTSKHTQPQNNTTSREKLAGWARHHVVQPAGHPGAAEAGAQAAVIRHRPGRGGCGASVAAAAPRSAGARSILFPPRFRLTLKFDAFLYRSSGTCASCFPRVTFHSSRSHKQGCPCWITNFSWHRSRTHDLERQSRTRGRSLGVPSTHDGIHLDPAHERWHMLA